MRFELLNHRDRFQGAIHRVTRGSSIEQSNQLQKARIHLASNRFAAILKNGLVNEGKAPGASVLGLLNTCFYIKKPLVMATLDRIRNRSKKNRKQSSDG